MSIKALVAAGIIALAMHVGAAPAPALAFATQGLAQPPAVSNRDGFQPMPHLLLVADGDDGKVELAKQYINIVYGGDVDDMADLMSRNTLIYVTKNRELFDAAIAAMRQEAEQRGGVETMEVTEIEGLWVDVKITFGDGTEKETTVFFDEEDGAYKLDLVPASGSGADIDK